MSFILDALKKSDQQRQLGAAPTLATVAPDVEPENTRPILIYMSTAVVVVTIGLLVAWFILDGDEPKKGVSSTDVKMPERTIALPDRVHDIGNHDVSAVAKAEPVPNTPRTTAENGVITTQAELPLSIQREIPKMSVAVHVFSTLASKRFATINGQQLHEGDFLIPLLKLEKITADGMIFSYKEYRFRVNVH